VTLPEWASSSFGSSSDKQTNKHFFGDVDVVDFLKCDERRNKICCEGNASAGPAWLASWLAGSKKRRLI
jgi:hypothetical protein